MTNKYRHPDLESIFRCDDQSALINNFVANVNPTPGAWSHHAMPQSALGQVSFPEVLTIARGEVYLRDAPGVIVEQMADRASWTPWGYHCNNERMSVERRIGQDVWRARVTVPAGAAALLLLECVPGAGIDASRVAVDRGFLFGWDKFEARLEFGGDVERIDSSDDPAPLRRLFAGFDDVPLSPSHAEWAWKYLRRAWMGVQFTGQIEVSFNVAHAGEQASVQPSLEVLAASERGRWQEFFDQEVPPLTTSDPVLRDAYYFAWQMLWSNRCSGGAGQLPHPLTSPARLHYGSQWWWDEAFNSLMYRHLTDPSLPYQFLDNFREAAGSDGMIPGYLGFTRPPGSDAPIGMQPPVLGFVLQFLKDRPGWPADLASLYDFLLRHARWHDLPHRDTDGDGVVEYHDQNDSATDQSTRWDAFKLDANLVMGPLRPTEAVDGNVWMSIFWDVLGDMAGELGDRTASASHHERARRMMELVDELMWDETDGFYYDIDARSHRRNPVKTPFGFMPMLSRHARADRITRMVTDHLTNPAEFWTAFPLSSVAQDDASFTTYDMFRGPTWVNINWMVVEGLSRRGYPDLATELARKTVEMVGSRYVDGERVRSPRLWEWYDPLTGEPMGNCQYSWSALVVDLIIRFLDK